MHEPTISATTTEHAPTDGRDFALSPVPPNERIAALDLVRGIALLGIIVVNSFLFGLPMIDGFGTPDFAAAPRADVIAWWIVIVGFQWAFISSFSMLFGAGFAMMHERARRRGQSVAGPFLRRTALLAMFGIAHVVLLWYGDVLFAYAVIAPLLLVFSWLRWRSLLFAGAALVVIGAVLTTGVTVLQTLAGSMAPIIDADVATGLRGADAMRQSQFNPAHPVWIAAETAAHRDGPYAEAMRFRVTIWAFAVIGGVFSYVWFIAGAFFLGAGLMACGFFAAEPTPGVCRARRLLLLALPLAIVVRAACAGVTHMQGGSSPVAALTMLPEMLGGAMMALGLLAAACVVTRRQDPVGPLLSGPVRAVAAAGRMPLTLYLMQSLVFVAFMDHWGLGLFASIGRLGLIGMAVAIWVVQVLLANLWFVAFRIGPLEWLWRWATYLRRPRLRA